MEKVSCSPEFSSLLDYLQHKWITPSNPKSKITDENMLDFILIMEVFVEKFPEKRLLATNFFDHVMKIVPYEMLVSSYTRAYKELGNLRISPPGVLRRLLAKNNYPLF